MTDLATICIPSNRPLIDSVEPLWSAINYAEATGMKVVISDNSGDPEKREYFAAAPEHVKYIADGPESAAENVLSALAAADSEFVLLLGDDDFIRANEDVPGIDLSSLLPDVIGVKPRIELWSAKGGVSEVNEFTLDEGDAASRVIEYSRKMGGGNSSYYSFFRGGALREIYRLFVGHHPTKAGNSDFALVYALAASGKIVHDPSITIRYDNARWANFEAASEAMDKLFDAAGLPRAARAYMLLFHYLDSYVLMFRDGPEMPVDERYKAAYAVGLVFLKRLLSRVNETPAEYVAAMDLFPHLAEAVNSDDPDINKMFHIAGLIADRVKPGLKQQYDQYLLAAIHGTPAA